VSTWWNGAATYYRGLLRGLDALGRRVTFYEPIAYDRQAHRDIDDPPWAQVVVYPADDEAQVRATVARASGADVIVKTSGVGVFDDVLADAVVRVAKENGAVPMFHDVDAPATLAELERDRGHVMHALLPQFHTVLTYGGGRPVQERYAALGAPRVELIYNALDPETHHRVPADPRFAADVSLLANRLPDRERRIEQFFIEVAAAVPDRSFLLGGNGWDDKPMPSNVRCIGHVGTSDHTAFNCSATAVLNVTRDSMVANGWSPATRVFEAAGAGACLITDAWAGIEQFLEPGREVLVAADTDAVIEHVRMLDAERAQSIGCAAAERVLGEHTYLDRATTMDQLLRAACA
jgi:spore maturation protein CgeB